MRKSFVFLVVLAALASLSFPTMSRADGVVTLTMNPNSLTVTEGNTLTVTFTLTDGTNADVAINNFAGGAAFFTGTGDPTDFFANSTIDEDHCRFMTLGAGKSCLFSIDYITESGAGETDGDFGVNESGLCAEVQGQADACTPDYMIIVRDSPVTAPEPSSLFLLGTGFVGVLGGVRRRVRRGNWFRR